MKLNDECRVMNDDGAEAENLHFRETPEGRLLVRLNSLLQEAVRHQLEAES